MGRLPDLGRRAVAAAAMVLLLAPVAARTPAAAGADGHWQPQSVGIEMDSDHAPYWKAVVSYSPSFEISNGQLRVRFGGTVTVQSTSKACADAAGGDSCLERWRYPEQHISSISVTFDRGAPVTKELGMVDSGTTEFSIPDGATRITHMEATVGDALYNLNHDSHGFSTDVTRQPGRLVFADALSLQSGTPSAATGGAAPDAGTPSNLPWWLVGLAAAAAAIFAATKLRRARATGSDIANEPLGEPPAPSDTPLPKRTELPDVTNYPKYVPSPKDTPPVEIDRSVLLTDPLNPYTKPPTPPATRSAAGHEASERPETPATPRAMTRTDERRAAEAMDDEDDDEEDDEDDVGGILDRPLGGQRPPKPDRK